MEEFYNSINKAINIDEDREKYTKLYNFVKNAIIKGLKEDEIFSALFHDLSLRESYAKPDEFDLIVRLEFPCHESIFLEPDQCLGGNINIIMLVVSRQISDNFPKMDRILEFIKEITDIHGYYLLQDKFQSWFQRTLTEYLFKIDCTLDYGCNEKVLLKYIKQEQAHTVKVCRGKTEISIDFVPGIRFTTSQSILCPMSRDILANDCWEAIPKPINGISSNSSFQCSYSETERRLLSSRNQVKNALRMMKKFRDMNPELVNLKGYTIKTLFLFHIDKISQSNWDLSDVTTMDQVFESLEGVLAEHQLQSYFSSSPILLNLTASEHQIDRMYHEVKNARTILAKRSNIGDLQNIKNLFLTKSEQQKMSPELEQEIERNFWQVSQVATGSYLVPWIVGIFGAVVVIGSILVNSHN